MENINFYIQEKEQSAKTNDAIQLAFYYNSNYNVKSLNQILQYYGINKNKMVKEEMVQVLAFFETDPANAAVVFNRTRLWQNIAELKTDSYFSKYIMF